MNVRSSFLIQHFSDDFLKPIAARSAEWLVVGALLCACTSLRYGDFPFGPGEAMILLVLGCSLAWRRSPHGAAWFPICLFWCSSLALLCLGTATSLLTDLVGPLEIGREGFAYLFVAAFSICLSAQWSFSETRARRIISSYFYVICALFFAIYSISSFFPEGGGLRASFWYSIRYRGLSVNPNQLAFLLLPLPWFGCFLYQSSRFKAERRAILLLSTLALVVGRATRSDALDYAWLASGLAILGWLAIKLTLKYLPSPRSKLAFLTALIAVLTFLVSFAFVESYDISNWFSRKSAAGNSKLLVRLQLWSSAFESAARSPAWGNGLGYFSNLAGDVTVGRSEAHNEWADWITKTGLLGIFLLWALRIAQLTRIYLDRNWPFFLLWLSFLVFNSFHYLIRHPFYWVLQILLLTPMSQTSDINNQTRDAILS